MDTKEKAFAWVDAHRDEMVDLWREMVSIDSGIGVKEGAWRSEISVHRVWKRWGFPFVAIHLKMWGHHHW